MTPEFVPAVREAVTIYREVYGTALVAVYVSGSVHRGEAVVGMSDLDMYPWVNTPPPPATVEQLRWRAKTRLAAWTPANVLKPARTLEWRAGAGIEASIQERARAWRQWCQASEMGGKMDDATQRWERYVGFASTLYYDATCVYGEDVLTGLPIPAIDAALARMYVWPHLAAVQLACRGQGSREFPLSAEPTARLRKVARRAVLLGDLVLMAWGQPSSGRGIDVLPALAHAAPQWSEFLDDTTRCYMRVESEAPTLESYLNILAEFADWCWQEITTASPVDEPG